MKGKYVYKNIKSHEQDLSKMEFRIGAEVFIRFKNGTEARGSCEVPKGFAGDKNKIKSVSEKFDRETFPVLGKEKALSIKHLFLNPTNHSLRTMFNEIFFNS